ncbi:related to e2 ubiquitin-conjugating enzyme [Phaffia rhodozyma]|uniref:E2 ubiquitin-conjugating enzyme n=1 Tax=Phaffia rhodozyma TaxID=264483 RepID=A0A0F7SYL7_PHARH|nr:related to e2 ubiquitin-conjugating enzyme [Phaffia rhodozyma]
MSRRFSQFFYVLLNIPYKMTDSIPASSVRRIAKELGQLRKEPPEGVRVVVDEEDITMFTAWVQGPDGTPYTGGYFRVKFEFGSTYPSQPPKCTFVTRIFHPNVSKQGEICVDTLKRGWKPEFGISHILSVIRCLLIYPNPESALDEEAGKLLLEAYEDYCKHARLFTSIHATPKNPPTEFAQPTKSTTITSQSSQAPLGTPLLPVQSGIAVNVERSTVPVVAPESTQLAGSGVKIVGSGAGKAGGTKAGAKRGLKRL